MKKGILIILVLVLFSRPAYADTVTDNALNFLKSKQDSTGRITGGFSAPSQWSAIAFALNNIDTQTIKNPAVSLKDFLLSDVPTNQNATEYESRILAIVAIDSDPSEFGGTNYIQKLEGFYVNSQLGDTCALNDDIFGLIALIAGGNLANSSIKQSVLDFIISKQSSTDGGFGWSAPGCAWYSTAPDMSAAAVVALQAAKDNGLTNPSLDISITKAKDYLLLNQNSDGGFGYFGSSDTDTTGWALIGLNSLGMKDSTQGLNAKNYLLSKQSSTDGGFKAFDWGLSTEVSNSTTTAQSLIALSGKTWIIKIFTPPPSPIPTPSPTATPSATLAPTPSPTPTPSPSPSSASSSVSSTPSPSPSPSPTPIPTSRATPSAIVLAPIQKESLATPSPAPTPQPGILGEQIALKPKVSGYKDVVQPTVIVLSLFTVFKFLEVRRWIK